MGPLSRVNIPLLRNWFQPYNQKLPRILFMGDTAFGTGSQRRNDDTSAKMSRVKVKYSALTAKHKKFFESKEKKSAKRDSLLKADATLKAAQPRQGSPRSLRVHRERRHADLASRDLPIRSNLIDSHNTPSEFGRAMERMISLSSPKARTRLMSLWKRIRTLLLSTASTSSSFSGGNAERADELTKALFQQLFKQFDLPSILRRRADKLRRRVGGSSSAGEGNSTEVAEVAKHGKDDGIRLVDFRKKSDDKSANDIDDKTKGSSSGVSGDQQVRQWLNMVTENDQKMAQSENIETDRSSGSSSPSSVSSTSTTTKPSATSSTRYPSMSLFQRRKGPVRVAVKLPQKHAKSGIKRFTPVQGRDGLLG